MNYFQKVIFQAPVPDKEIDSSFVHAMRAMHRVKQEGNQFFYEFPMRLPGEGVEQRVILQSVCSFFRVKEYTIKNIEGVT
ncbi:hypothetical protein EP56_01640 [Listeriaceae bacterium FSL A5-0209]|nr:hypothetical protein EP56_01640 [Listeriaceae bacterium FSL A5-0209]